MSALDFEGAFCNLHPFVRLSANQSIESLSKVLQYSDMAPVSQQQAHRFRNTGYLTCCFQSARIAVNPKADN